MADPAPPDNAGSRFELLKASDPECTRVINVFPDGRIDAGGGIVVTRFDEGRVIALLHDWVWRRDSRRSPVACA
jgi:hypothetical protein